MKLKLLYSAATLSLLSVVPASVSAGTLNGLDDFTPEGAVYADDMNQKMQDISNAVNDNNQKIDSHVGNTSLHHNRYTDNEAQAAMGAKGNTNALNHDRYSDTEAVNAMGFNQADNPLKHNRYTDNEAVNAMGATANDNPLNHDRYTDADAVNAMGPQSSGNPLNHSRYTDAEVQAMLDAHIANDHHNPPLMWVSIDPLDAYEPVDTKAEVEINTVAIDVPADGFLVIAGMSNVRNDSAATEDTYLVPYIDGNYALASDTFPGWATYVGALPGAKESMAYTITVPITAGLHTVSHTVFIDGAPTNFSYDRNHLTVTYFPQQLGTIVNLLP
jgi:hypothetical protein